MLIPNPTACRLGSCLPAAPRARSLTCLLPAGEMSESFQVCSQQGSENLVLRAEKLQLGSPEPAGSPLLGARSPPGSLVQELQPLPPPRILQLHSDAATSTSVRCRCYQEGGRILALRRRWEQWPCWLVPPEGSPWCGEG